MNCALVKINILTWLQEYNGFVVGISGGVDSALVSTLCAMTDKPTIVVSLPIHQSASHLERAHKHIAWLKRKYNNVASFEIDLTDTFESLTKGFVSQILPMNSLELTLANARARLRMTNLYCFSNLYGYVVAGTGNRIEDYGVGFFTKYGDGGVDISPIGDLLKTEVFQFATWLGIDNSILQAKPTDGLWADDRSDEDQIGATYPELEWAMEYLDHCHTNNDIMLLTERQLQVLKIYQKRHNDSQHKMSMPPICKVNHGSF